MIPLKLTRAHSPTKDTGRIFSWLVAEGAEVRNGQPVVEIELGRVTMELEAPGNGVIHIVAERGATVPIGATLAEIRTPAELAAAGAPTGPAVTVEEAEDEAPAEEAEAEPEPAAAEPAATRADVEQELEPAPIAPGQPPEPEPVPAPEPEPVAAQPEPAPPAQEPLATPAARRLADEVGVDLADVQGTGPDGRILAEDVEKVAASRPATQVISALETEGEIAASEESAPVAPPAAAAPAPEPAAAQPQPAPPFEPAPEPAAAQPHPAPPSEPAPEPAPAPEPVAPAEPAAEPELTPPEPEPVAAAASAPAAETPPAMPAPVALPPPAAPEPAAAAATVAPAAVEAPAPPAAARAGFYVHMGGELAADGLVDAHRTASRKFEGRTTVTDLLIMVVARALTDVPELNGTIDANGRPDHSAAVHLALSDASERAEEAPVVRNAPSLTLEEIAAERQRLAEAAQKKTLSDDDLAGATSTFSNLGGYPLDFYVPSAPGAEIALVTTGRVMEKPISFQRMLTIRPRMWVSVSLDARGADAETGGRFLAALQKRLNDLPNTV
jgi:pyruvate dehydrogenase E2 component (dihydrolipoamide acetyltransferase)